MRRLLTILVLLAACSSGAATEGPAVETLSGVAPALGGETLTGEVLDPADLAGHVLVVNLWATWCGPCEREQPILAEAARAHQAGGVAFLGIDERDDPDAARRWLERYDVPYPSLSDPSGYLAYRFGAPFLPATIVIDADGRLRYRVVGPIDRDTLDRLVRSAAEPVG